MKHITSISLSSFKSLGNFNPFIERERSNGSVLTADSGGVNRRLRIFVQLRYFSDAIVFGLMNAVSARSDPCRRRRIGRYTINNRIRQARLTPDRIGSEGNENFPQGQFRPVLNPTTLEVNVEHFMEKKQPREQRSLY